VAKEGPSWDDRAREKAEKRARIGRLDERIGLLCANINAAQAELVEALGEFDDLDGWHVQHATDARRWLAWRANVSPRSGREMFALAQSLKGLPKIQKAFASGALTYDQARTIAKVAEESTEDILLQLAEYTTVAQLERICSVYARASRLQGPQSGPEDERRVLGYHFDDEGFMELFGRLLPEDGAVVQKALEAVAQRLRSEQEENTVTGRTHGQRSADALVEMARISLADDGKGTAGAPSEEVMVHTDLDMLRNGEGRCHLEGGPALAPGVLERILCDSFVTVAVEKDGAVIDVDKRRRTATARQKKALLARDHMCIFPGCTYHRFVEAHHREFHGNGGDTVLPNLHLLCRMHHRLVHSGKTSMELGDDGEVVFKDKNGNVIEPVPTKPEGSVKVLIRDNKARGLELDAETPKSGWDGTSVSLFDCGDAIFREREKHERESRDPPPSEGAGPPPARAANSPPEADSEPPQGRGPPPEG
jgi:hypothetical protein